MESGALQGNNRQLQNGANIYSGVQGSQLQSGAGSATYGSSNTSEALRGPAQGRLEVEANKEKSATATTKRNPETLTPKQADNNFFVWLALTIVATLMIYKLIKSLLSETENSSDIQILNPEQQELSEKLSEEKTQPSVKTTLKNPKTIKRSKPKSRSKKKRR